MARKRTKQKKERNGTRLVNDEKRNGEPRRSIDPVDRSVDSSRRYSSCQRRFNLRFYDERETNRSIVTTPRENFHTPYWIHRGSSTFSSLTKDLGGSAIEVRRVATVDGARLYLRGDFVIRDVRLDAERPLDVQQVFVQLQQKDDEDEEGVHHKERKDALVA